MLDEKLIPQAIESIKKYLQTAATDEQLLILLKEDGNNSNTEKLGQAKESNRAAKVIIEIWTAIITLKDMIRKFKTGNYFEAKERFMKAFVSRGDIDELNEQELSRFLFAAISDLNLLMKKAADKNLKVDIKSIDAGTLQSPNRIIFNIEIYKSLLKTNYNFR